MKEFVQFIAASDHRTIKPADPGRVACYRMFGEVQLCLTIGHNDAGEIHFIEVAELSAGARAIVQREGA